MPILSWPIATPGIWQFLGVFEIAMQSHNEGYDQVPSQIRPRSTQVRALSPGLSARGKGKVISVQKCPVYDISTDTLE